mmetsp:Transcript_20619/g.38452  ORF Transcript_20619/g.38452 Transcript_20619/m.38452 type:complete len:1386 (+) Transcript_20619:39-4196(+)
MCGNLGLLLCSEDRNANSTRGIPDEEEPSIPLLCHLLESRFTHLDPDSRTIPESTLPLLHPLKLIHSQCTLTEMRGGQSAGLASVSWADADAKCVRTRKIIPKRDTACNTIIKAWRNVAHTHGGVKSLIAAPDSVLLMGHLRFATSSRNMVSESHPHIWCPWARSNQWKLLPDPDAPSKFTFQRFENKSSGHVLTHNGDFDAVRLYDKVVPMKQVGLWLERILHCPNTVDSDSAKIAGYFDVFATKGDWYKSARRAWVLAVAKVETDACGEQDLSIGAPNTAPTEAVVTSWARLMEDTFTTSEVTKLCPSSDSSSFVKAVRKLEKALVTSFSNQKFTQSMEKWKHSQIEAFVVEAVTSFMTADSYTCMGTFLRCANGSFGLAVSSASEEGSIVLAAFGQPMAFSIDPATNVVLYGSESTAIRVPVQENKAPLRYRYNLDDHDGETVRIGTPNHNQVLVDALFSSEDDPPDQQSHTFPTFVKFSPHIDCEIGVDSLLQYCDAEDIAEKFTVQLAAATIPPQNEDTVEKDLLEIPATLRDITRDWGDLESANVLAANDFVHLFAECRMRHGSDNALDVIITGIESSLWLGEQFAADLKIMFPKINVVAVSANKLLGALEEVPRMVHFAGYTRIAADDLRRDKPVVLCISQSGQTFATLHATRLLLRLLGGNVFLCTGVHDSKMRDAVIDYLGPEAGDRRVIHNHSGVRLAEPSTVASCAMHHTLTEFLMYIGQCACLVNEEAAREAKAKNNSRMPFSRRSRSDSVTFNTKLAVVREDMIDFRDLVDSIHDNVEDMVSSSGLVNARLRSQGILWAKHITEVWRVMVLCGLYILISVISGWPLFRILFSFQIIFGEDKEVTAIAYTSRVLDALFYILLPKLLSYFMRWWEGRSIFARHGKRTLVICDVPYVYKQLENYVTKLFALSYSFMNIEVHGTCAHDDMVHCFTHRVARGTLIALGRPDGRILSLLKTEQTIMLAAKQAAFIENMGVGPEILTIGHNNVQSSIATNHICIPTSRRKFLSESLYDFALAARSSSQLGNTDVEKTASLILRSLYNQSTKMGGAYPRRLLTVGVIHARDSDDELDGSVTSSVSMNTSSHSQLQSTPSNNRSRSDTGQSDDYAEEVLALTAARDRPNNLNLPPDTPTSVADSDAATPRSVNFTFASNGGKSPGIEDYSSAHRVSYSKKPQRDDQNGVLPGDLNADPLRGSKHATPSLSLEARYAFAMKLPKEVRQKLDKTQAIEHLFESRVASFERYIAMLVSMHAMAQHASKPWLLPRWDVSRSQSNLRVATTACPVCVEEGDDGEVWDNDKSSHVEEFDNSKHVINESKKRIGEGMDKMQEFFPASIVAMEAVDEDEVSRLRSMPPVVSSPPTRVQSTPNLTTLAIH